MLKLIIFVPESHKEKVKNAVFECGAGRQGEYSECCWEVLGTGQFVPSVSAIPAIGSQNELSRVTEYRVEMLCPEHLASDVKRALTEAHPYEEPAFEFVPIKEI